jgi:hypothetical protein
LFGKFIDKEREISLLEEEWEKEKGRKANCPLWKARNRRLSEAVKCGFFFVFPKNKNRKKLYILNLTNICDFQPL